jgi:3-hydroxyisobutyrate dehydrogenase-like beta-hydroxyacid dehydrogenase
VSDGPVGFVGVGNLGAAMALRTLEQGGAVVAFDPAPPAAAAVAEAGVDLAQFAAIVRHSEAQSGMQDSFIGEWGLLFDGAGTLGAIGPHESPTSQEDLSAALELAARHGVDLPLVTTAHDETPAVWGIG